MTRLMCLIFGVLCLSGSVHADIFIRGFADATNDRFTNDPSFIMNTGAGPGGTDAFDLSGVGKTLGGRWATAISRNVVIGAFHSTPGGAIEFYEDNDPSSTAVVRNLGAGVQVPGTDLVLAVLNEDLPNSVAHYDFAQEAIVGTLPGALPPFPVDPAGIYQGMNTYMFGFSETVHTTTQDQAVGRNLITGYSENFPNGLANQDLLIMELEPDGHPDAVAFEARLQSGDSGAPAFVEIGGQLRLIGTNAIIYGDGDFVNPGIGSGVNYTGNQAAFINSFISANASVPEPSSWCLLAAGLTLLSRRRRMRG